MYLNILISLIELLIKLPIRNNNYLVVAIYYDFSFSLEDPQ
jgi:hypothetical protein